MRDRGVTTRNEDLNAERANSHVLTPCADYGVLIVVGSSRTAPAEIVGKIADPYSRLVELPVRFVEEGNRRRRPRIPPRPSRWGQHHRPDGLGWLSAADPPLGASAPERPK